MRNELQLRQKVFQANFLLASSMLCLEVWLGALCWVIQGLICVRNNLAYLMIAINLKP